MSRTARIERGTKESTVLVEIDPARMATVAKQMFGGADIFRDADKTAIFAAALNQLRSAEQ